MEFVTNIVEPRIELVHIFDLSTELPVDGNAERAALAARFCAAGQLAMIVLAHGQRLLAAGTPQVIMDIAL